MAKHKFHLSRPTGVPKGGVSPFKVHTKIQPLPAPTGPFPFRLDLKDVLPPKDYQHIQDSGVMVFHIVGDTGGVKDPVPQQLVANHMEGQFTDQTIEHPSFFYHLGDVVYYYGERASYNSQFYEPYKFYPAPILGIPGNHDGDVDPTQPAVSLAAFSDFFCAEKPVTPPEAGDSPRTTMTQPNVYWTFQTPFADFIGLYTNVPEGGVVSQEQSDWLVQELKNSGKAANRAAKALIVTLHHPPYSLDNYHSGSTAMQDLLNSSFQAAGVQPDLVFSAHVHNFQRFTQTQGKMQIPYIVNGAGGYWNLHRMDHKTYGTNGYEIITPLKTPYPGMILENYSDDRHGFMRITIDSKTRVLKGEYFTVPRPQESWKAKEALLDYFELDLQHHTISNGQIH